MSTQPTKKQKDKVEPKGKDGLTRSERMRENDKKLMREKNKERAKKRRDEINKEANEKAQKERREKAQKERLKNESKKRESNQSGKDKFKESLKNKSSKKPKEAKKLPGEGVKKTPAKMPDGFTMDRPAHKLGYIQKLGAGRMSPGKMGDMTAMKMMHGDAAAKYYDGAGMYMNGAPKYEGASKSYVGPMTPGHGGAPGHTHGDKTVGDVSFSIGSEGAKLTDKVTQTKSTGSSTSSGSKTKVVDKGDDVFYNNLISSAKNMSDMKSKGIDPRDKKAVLNYGNQLHASRQKSSSGGSTTTSTSSSTKSNPRTEKAIQDTGRYEMKKIIGQDNLSRYDKEMQAVQDSTSMANKVFKGLLDLNPDRSPGTVAGMKEISGRYGHEAANVTRKKHNIPQTYYGDFGQGRQNIKRGAYHEGYISPGTNEKRFLKNPFAKDGKSAYVARKSNDRVIKQPYGRKESIFTDIDKVFPKDGTPKMPKGPMKYGMKK